MPPSWITDKTAAFCRFLLLLIFFFFLKTTRTELVPILTRFSGELGKLFDDVRRLRNRVFRSKRILRRNIESHTRVSRHITGFSILKPKIRYVLLLLLFFFGLISKYSLETLKSSNVAGSMRGVSAERVREINPPWT